MDTATSNSTLLTIVMPVYNAAAYIEQALETILAQSFGDYELLVLDAQSTDQTKAIVQQKQSKNQQIRFLSEPDQGIYDAMNKGIAHANGTWLYFMGCDDIFFDASVLEKMAAVLKTDVDLVYGDVLWVPDEVVENGECTASLLINRNINHQRIFYRKSLFQHYGGYDLQYRIASDHELNIRFFCNNNVRKQYIPVTVARYHSGGFSANKTDEVFWTNWKQIFKENFSKHLSNKLMYEKLGWYCRNLIERHQYKKAMPVFFDVLLHTFSPGFVKLTMEQYFKSRRFYAG